MHEHINDAQVAMVMARILFIASQWAKKSPRVANVLWRQYQDGTQDTLHMTLTHSSVPHHPALDGLHRDHKIVLLWTS